MRFVSVFRLNRAETDLNREIQSHLQLLEDAYVAKGMAREDARYAARRTFGGVEQAKEHQRDARGVRWMDNWRIDLTLGARMLAKYPGLSTIGGIGLAVGIAIGTAFFAFFYSYAYATIPGFEGERVVGLENWSIKTNNEVRQAAHDFVTWRDGLKTITELGAFRTVGRNLFAAGTASESIRIAEITATGLAVPRVPPRLGRALQPADEASDAAPVLVIGSNVWATRFNSDPAVIGREVRVGETVHTIIGVMPDGFEFPVNHDFWTALQLDPSRHARRAGPAIFIFGRLAPGVTMEQAQAELTTIASNASAQFPDTHGDLRARVMPYAHPILDIQGITSWELAMAQSMVTLLLIIVALNVATLIYARTATRQGEIAVRAALGASRGRIVTQLFLEALVLCGFAALAGVLLAQVGLGMGHAIMETEAGRLPYFVNLGVPVPAYAYVALVTFIAAVIAGVVPALQSTGRGMESRLKDVGSRSGARLGGVWSTMIVAQVAIAVAGLPIAFGVFWSSIKDAATAASFETRPYLAATIASDPEPPPGVDRETYGRESAIRLTRLQAELIERLDREPRVEAVTLAQAIPGNEPTRQVEVEGVTPPLSGPPSVQLNAVAEDFFDAFDASLIGGRWLTSADARNAGHPIVVNHAFVRQVLGNRDAVGRRVRFTPAAQDGSTRGADAEPWHDIVGVAADLYTNPIDPELVRPVVFQPLDPSIGSRATLLVKVRGHDAAAFAMPLREIAMALDPALRINLRTFVDMDRQQQLVTRLIVLALSLITLAALLLSAAGIYAMMSFTVSRRRKEIGIRAAMGADTAQLLRGIFARSAMQLGIGVIVGCALAFLTDAMAGGDGLGPTGRTIFVPLMAAVMIAVGVVASIGPARRGLQVQPTEALRAE